MLMRKLKKAVRKEYNIDCYCEKFDGKHERKIIGNVENHLVSVIIPVQFYYIQTTAKVYNYNVCCYDIVLKDLLK